MLSTRLHTISDMIMKDEVVFDCGSDHALLPCFLVKNKLSPKVYAGDLRIEPLNQARANIKRFGLQDQVIPVLSNGIEKMGPDVRVLTISGMGFHTVKTILDQGDLSNLKQIIVQVNRNVDKLREYINSKNYTITDEEVVYDDFYYEIIAFTPNYNAHSYTAKQLRYGPVLLKKRTETFIAYLQYQLATLNKIYQNSHNEALIEEINLLQSIIKATD